MRRPAFVTALILLVASSNAVIAQSRTPTGWQWHLDRTATLVTEQEVPESSWRFVTMSPGWHVTTGPGVTLSDSSATASGRYSIAADFVLFPRPSDSGFGLFLGGTGLGTQGASYLTVMLRRDGAVGVFHTERGAERTIYPYTVHPAIRQHPGSGVVSNRLRVGVARDSLRVFVNDSALVTLGRAALPAEGRFGFRIGEGINLHLTTLDHIRHLAP